VLGTLLHEATHGVAATRGIKDTSRQGRYHNTRFRELATELGISVERDPAIGWSITTVPDPTAAQYEHEIGALGAALTAHRLADVHAGGRTSSNNGLVATCACDPPRKIRLSRSAYDTGPVFCGVCEAQFTSTDTQPSETPAAAEGRALMPTSDDRNSRARESTADQVDPWGDDGARLVSARDAEISEVRQRRPGLFTLHEAAVNAVTAREHAHEAVARRTLDRAAELIDIGHDERAAAEVVQAELAAAEAAEPEQLQHILDGHAGRVASPVIDRDLEARVLAVPVTAQHIDAARTTAERDLLVDLAACQQAITRLRDTRYTSTAAEATGLYLECREQHGRGRDQARDAAFLEVGEGIRAEHDTARYRLDAQAEQRRDERAPAQRGDADAGVNQDADHEVAVPAPRGASWEEVRAPLLRVGDVTPRGPITAIDYHGELGVTLHIADEEYHRGRDNVVSRRADSHSNARDSRPERVQPPAAREREDLSSVEDSLDVDPDELAQLTAGAHERRASASHIPDDIERLCDMLVRDHETTRQRRPTDPDRHQHHADQGVAEDDHRGDDPVHRARVAVDLLTARHGLDQRQRAEQARSQQVARWQRDDQRREHTATTASTETTGRAIDGRGLGR
jgi:hypothetical protein